LHDGDDIFANSIERTNFSLVLPYIVHKKVCDGMSGTVYDPVR